MRNLCLDKDLAVLKKAVYKVENGIKSKVLRDIVLEYPLNLYINGNIINTFLCTQGNLKELVIGYAKSKGFIQNLDDIKRLEIDKKIILLDYIFVKIVLMNLIITLINT